MVSEHFFRWNIHLLPTRRYCGFGGTKDHVWLRHNASYSCFIASAHLELDKAAATEVGSISSVAEIAANNFFLKTPDLDRVTIGCTDWLGHSGSSTRSGIGGGDAAKAGAEECSSGGVGARRCCCMSAINLVTRWAVSVYGGVRAGCWMVICWDGVCWDVAKGVPWEEEDGDSLLDSAARDWEDDVGIPRGGGLCVATEFSSLWNPVFVIGVVEAGVLEELGMSGWCGWGLGSWTWEGGATRCGLWVINCCGVTSVVVFFILKGKLSSWNITFGVTYNFPLLRLKHF